MFYCAYHRRCGRRQCNQCARRLCPHAISHSRFSLLPGLHCGGRELLRQQSQTSAALPAIANVASSGNPAVFCSGLGAAYNGKQQKRLSISLSLRVSFRWQYSLRASSFCSGSSRYLAFCCVDACRTAQLIRAGLTPETEEDVITRRLYGNPLHGA